MSAPPANSPRVRLRSPGGAIAQVHHDGAHVTSWRPAPDGEERLFLSERTELRQGVAIRGGIPVIFPQFAAEGPLPRHGFARTMRWELEGVRDADALATARFTLRSSAATRAIWPASFVATLDAALGDAQLTVTLSVTNEGDAPISFTAALHTYLRVRDIGAVALHGLQGVMYRESIAPTLLKRDDQAVLRVHDEMDRVYVNAPLPLVLREPDRAVEISATGFPDVVVWNPGATKAAALPDMEPGGERRMLCVEAAAVQRPVVVSPGATWTAAQGLKTL